MAPVGIVGLGAYVPPDVMTNDDWAEIVDTSDEWITTKTGIKERRIAAEDVCTSDLAVIACKQAMDEAGIGPGDVDMLILATSSPDVPLSSTAGITQHKLGCTKAAASTSTPCVRAGCRRSMWERVSPAPLGTTTC